ncbi:hypothetical protein P0F65_07225 [Sphingomonas sp. I4]
MGERDRICVRTDARALSDRIAGARFHQIGNCGDLAPIERPRGCYGLGGLADSSDFG